MSEEHPKLTVIPSSNQQAMGQDLMDELREVINSSKFLHTTVSNMLKRSIIFSVHELKSHGQHLCACE